MLAFRKYLSWIYVFTAIVCFRLAVGNFVAIASPQHLHLSLRFVLWDFLMVVFAGVFTTAWWISLKAKSSARAWGLAASSLYIFTALLGGILAHRVQAANPLLLVIGGLGLVAFGKRQKMRLAVSTEDVTPIPGDFTSRHVNRVAQAVTFGLSLGAYFWWQEWLKGQHITALDGMGVRSALTLAVLLSITSIHETGHALVGMMCGMKLRAFFVGPFQWRIRDAKWEFEFKPKGLILADGVTALIPGEESFSRGSTSR